MVRLFERDVEASCKKNIEIHKNNCSGFIRAVVNDLLILVPGISSNADWQVEFMRIIETPSFRHLGNGQSGEFEAVKQAGLGNLVLCGMKSEELQENRPKQNVRHGHVAVVVDGWGKTGWPLAYWGSLGSKEGIRASLSKSFRGADRPSISYFVYNISHHDFKF